MADHPRFKGAPFNPRTIRWHKTRRGWEWQYWNYKVGRFCRHTRQALTVEQAKIAMASACYGCAPEDITVEGRGALYAPQV